MNAAHLIYRYFDARPAEEGEGDNVVFTLLALVGPGLVSIMSGLLIAVSNHLAMPGIA